jgi:TolA-binding protein
LTKPSQPERVEHVIRFVSAKRVPALEQRVRQLEDRVQQLEVELEKEQIKKADQDAVQRSKLESCVAEATLNYFSEFALAFTFASSCCGSSE